MPFKTTKNHLTSLLIASFAFALLSVFTACSQSLSGQKSSVSFCIDSDTVKELQIPAAAASASRSVADDLKIAKLSVTLNGAYSNTQITEITPEGAVVFFPDIPTGKKIWAQAEVYIENTSDGSKTILYTGKSKSSIIHSGENQLDIKLEKVEKQYNVVSKTASTYTVLNPTFTQEADGVTLETNVITFNHEKSIEQVYWKPADVNVYDYQRAKITYRGASLKTDQENVLAFKTLRAGTYKPYYRDQKAVTNQSQTYQMVIPQGKRLDSLGIENKWDSSIHDFQKDFSFEIEKIELIKDPALEIDYNALVYVDEWPELQVVNNAELNWDEKPGFKFTSKEGKGKEFENGQIDDGYASVYWEFDRIQDYDKIVLTVKVDNYKPEEGIRFTVKGYRPYYDNEEDKDYHSDYQSWVQFDTPATVKEPNDPVYGGESVRIVLAVSDILKGIQGDPGKSFMPTAIEIVNDLYSGTWGPDMEWYDDWGMKLEKIELIRYEQKNDLVIFDPDTVELTGLSFNGYIGDAAPQIKEIGGKKYLEVTPDGYALNVELPDVIDVSGYLYVVAEVAFANDSSDLQAGVVMRNRPQTNQPMDYIQRTVLDAMCEATIEGRNAVGVICGSEKIKQFSAYILNKANSNNPTANQQMFIGKIYATTKKNIPVKYSQSNGNSGNDPVEQEHDYMVIAGAKWATMNYGATSEKEVGTPVDCNYTAYRADSTNNWGSDWEVATDAQWGALIANCFWVLKSELVGTGGNGEEYYQNYFNVYPEKHDGEFEDLPYRFATFLPPVLETLGYSENDPHLVIPVDGSQDPDWGEGYYWPYTVNEGTPDSSKVRVISIETGGATTEMSIEGTILHPIRLIKKN